MKRFVLAAACVLYPCLLACAEPVEVSVKAGCACSNPKCRAVQES